MKTKAFRKFFGTLAVLALALGAGIAIRSVSAGTETGSGWLWGGGVTTNPVGYDGAGWASMNDTNAGSGGGTYGVNIPASGDLSGYAWNEHYGWISFNGVDLAGCAPALSQATRTGSNITGGARILSIRDAGANAGGFDGCISLSGTATNGSPYGVAVSGTTLGGYAWSSDLGWIDMSRASVGASPTLKLCYDSCATGPAVGANVGFAYNESHDIVACYNTASACDAPDNSGNVTTNLLTSWSESGANVVTSSVVNVGGVGDTKRWTSGSTSGTEIINVIYNGGSPISFDAGVSCSPSPNCDAARAGVCIGQTVSAGVTSTNACGTISCAGEQGTRYCDMNWKEVAPGQ